MLSWPLLLYKHFQFHIVYTISYTFDFFSQNFTFYIRKRCKKKRTDDIQKKLLLWLFLLITEHRSPLHLSLTKCLCEKSRVMIEIFVYWHPRHDIRHFYRRRGDLITVTTKTTTLQKMIVKQSIFIVCGLCATLNVTGNAYRYVDSNKYKSKSVLFLRAIMSKVK